MNDINASLAGNLRWISLTQLAGGVVMLVSLAWLVWNFWASYPPSFSRLTPMSGTIQTINFRDGKRGRAMEVMLEEHGRAQQLVLEDVERMPVLDWPLDSLRAGDHVVAWTAPSPNLSANQQEVWQLQIRRRRVVNYEDRAAVRSAEIRPALVFGFIGLVVGAALVTAAVVRRRRISAERRRLRTAT